VSETTPHDESDTAPVSARAVEFGEEENRLFRQLALRMYIVGVAILVWGFFQAPRIFGGDLGALALTLALMVTGIWTVGAARRFQAIVKTEGSDYSHLVRALRAVHHLYTLAAAVIAVIAVWVVVALGFTLVVTMV